MGKVYTKTGGIKQLCHTLSAFTGDNPLVNALSIAEVSLTLHEQFFSYYSELILGAI